MAFMDMPPESVLNRALRRWARPPAPAGLDATLQTLFKRVVPSPAPEKNNGAILDWLYAFIRLNIKRGPVFDLKQALRLHRADCLAYCKLFTVLGRRTGLDAGVVDVLIDSGGRYVPHTAIMVNTAGDRPRIVDPWYGSRDIRHRRLCVWVKERERWIAKDVDYSQLEGHEVNHLPDTYVDGITLYVLGNQHLASEEFAQAIDCYTRSITLYPESIRPFYNRAIAFEKLGESRKAEEDYGAAFAGENALIRTMAREYDEITDLMRLDEAEVEEEAQEMYLLKKGIITGRAMPLTRIAAGFGLSEDKVRAIILHGVGRRLKRAV
jgi:tetratricopeptide (TPR) repeat protein